jgi:hypothetical protein
MMQGGQQAPPEVEISSLEEMTPEQAMHILEGFNITPEQMPIIARAIEVAMAASEAPPQQGRQGATLDQALNAAVAKHGAPRA